MFDHIGTVSCQLTEGKADPRLSQAAEPWQGDGSWQPQGQDRGRGRVPGCPGAAARICWGGRMGMGQICGGAWGA